MIECTQITAELDKAFDEAFIRCSNDPDLLKPYVCAVCDEFVKRSAVKRMSIEELYDSKKELQAQGYHSITEELRNCYKIDIPEDTEDKLKELMLSPRASYMNYADRRHKEGLTTCKDCYVRLKNGQMPRFAISNGYFFGSPPECLLELSEIELALLTPVKTHGYCFVYTGGAQKQLKGTLCYYKVQIESICRTVAHFDALGLSDNIVVLLSGKMTPEQRKRAKQKNRLRVAHVRRALEWLIDNNKEWRHVDLEQVMRTLRNPAIVDGSINEANDSNCNIEKTESFEVYFPDGSISQSTGGQKSIEDFKDAVKKAKEAGFDVHIQADLMRTIVYDYKDNTLMNACLVQFPYGRGGINNEKRQTWDGSMKPVLAEDYVQHLSRISQPNFHKELFCLILYNFKLKSRMVKSAFWKVRNKVTASILGEQLTAEQLTHAINRKRRNQPSILSPGSHFLNSIDAVAQAIPHTNQAAKRARRDGEALQHHFGCPSYFLTVTPDDEGSLLLQIYSGIHIDEKPMDIDTLDDDELANMGKKRVKLRLSYPGICAWTFELILDTIIKDVLGWSDNEDERKEGLCGLLEAFTASIEEQGRKSLHVHFQLFIRKIAMMREQLYSHDRQKAREAQQYICSEIDRLSTSRFLSSCIRPIDAFNHSCSVPSRIRQLPKIMNDQHLRALRHIDGHREKGGVYLSCPHCKTEWTPETLAHLYLTNEVGVASLSEYPDTRVKRLKAMILQYQRSTNSTIDCSIIDAAYNMHCHTRSSCFKYAIEDASSSSQGAIKKRKCTHSDCRYRYPKRPRANTVIQNAGGNNAKWYSWDGTHDIRNIKEVLLRRHEYDVFQNQSCPAIGTSKLCTGNTNISLIMDGPTGQYSFKYCMKDTQKDDSAEFKHIADKLNRIMSRVSDSTNREEEEEQDEQTRQINNRKEAVRRLLAGSFAHQKNDVIGAPLSAYLCRNNSRFIFSHSFVWIPLKDICKLLEGGEVESMVIQSGMNGFFQCSALHYLCRPRELEHLSAFDYYSKYEVVRKSSRNADSMMELLNHGPFVHPSYKRKSNTFIQGVRERHTKCLAKILQYDFPDTSEFLGQILEPSHPSNNVMEKYAQRVLLLFFPLRKISDLSIDGSYRDKLIATVGEDDLLTSDKITFLQNVQNTAYNSFRITHVKDELERLTKSYNPTPENEFAFLEGPDDEEEEDAQNLQGEALDQFLESINNEGPDDAELTNNTPVFFSSKPTKDKGGLHCGYECLAKMSCTDNDDSPLVNIAEFENPEDSQDITNDQSESAASTGEEEQGQIMYDIVKVLLEKTSRRQVNRFVQTQTEVQAENTDVLEANGSVASIIDWAKAADLDRGQRRAFEMITASFVLTFFNSKQNNFSYQRRGRRAFIKERSRLRKLIEHDRRRTEQLIAFLYGPGGSGKTTVLDLVMEYAQEYCGYIEGFTFTSRTIVVTAMTGVAATLLLGETAHSAMLLNQRRPLEHEQIECWQDTRLVIVDEISFASKYEVSGIDKRTRELKQRLGKPYGGLNIVFSGDFRQLEPVGNTKKAIYKEHCPEFHDWTNCFLELNGMHRFRNDPEWGHLLGRFRNGTVTVEDIEAINKSCVIEDEEELHRIPDNVKYATFRNKDRDAINAALFEKAIVSMTQQERLSKALMVFCDETKVRNGSRVYVPFRRSNLLWKYAGEDEVKLPPGKGRMDPVLRLYKGCRVMLPVNSDVKSGKANGTQATVERIVLHNGAAPSLTTIGSNVQVYSTTASQVAYIELKHTNDRINPQTFRLRPQQWNFKTTLPHQIDSMTGTVVHEKLQMKTTQLPVIVNNATTGHKLQGSSVDELFVHNWSYVANWVYVMLSRVRTKSGLFARKKLSTKLSNYAVPDQLTRMMQKMQLKAASIWTEEEYENLFRDIV